MHTASFACKQIQISCNLVSGPEPEKHAILYESNSIECIITWGQESTIPVQIQQVTFYFHSVSLFKTQLSEQLHLAHPKMNFKGGAGQDSDCMNEPFGEANHCCSK